MIPTQNSRDYLLLDQSEDHSSQLHLNIIDNKKGIKCGAINGRAFVSPWQQLTIGMPETATIRHGHFINPRQKTFHRLLRGNTA